MQLPVTQSEDQFQAECFQWHWNNRPEERGLLFHVNQKARNAIEGNRFKAMGVVPGVSDLIYLIGPLFIEMKTEAGTQSDPQKRFQALVESLGYRYVICRPPISNFQFLFPHPAKNSNLQEWEISQTRCWTNWTLLKKG